MDGELRTEERFAVEVLRRHLGACFTAFDDNSTDGMVDGLFELPDGLEGALEVTTLTSRDAMQFEALTLGKDWSELVENVEWFWAIWVATGLDLKAMRTHLGEVLRAAEAAGEHRLEVAMWLGDSPSHHWIRAQDKVLHGFGSDSGKFPGLVQLIPNDNHATFIKDEMGRDLSDWIELELQSDAIQRKISKLNGTARPEQHLFLRVHESAPSDLLLHALCFGDELPARAVDVAHGLTGLWLAPRWGAPLRWSDRSGWSRFDYEVLAP